MSFDPGTLKRGREQKHITLLPLVLMLHLDGR
jgi:hypothetical protein